MFITQERANTITGGTFGLTIGDVALAQTMIEMYIGRVEANIDDADDVELCARATAFQAVYMKGDQNDVLQMARMDSITQDSSSIQFTSDQASPFIAQFAVFALRNLSWKKSRSISTAPTQLRQPVTREWKRD